MLQLDPIRCALWALLAAVLAIGAPARQAQAAPGIDDAAPLSPRNANYTMEVVLDPEARELRGRQVLSWRNDTAHVTGELRYHLYYNAWRNDRSSWFRRGRGADDDAAEIRPEHWARSDIESIALVDASGAPVADLTDVIQFIAPDDGNIDDRTVLLVPLPEPVGPGQTVQVELTWTAKIPRTFARTGVRGDYYFLAQWFPKVGVLDPDGLWNCHQFIQTEFYADFGMYDVSLRVPTGWVVGATGRETERIRHDNGTTTHRYVQADVHDFAWTTAPDFEVREQRFVAEGLPEVDMRLLLRPEHGGTDSMGRRYFEATAAALQWYGTWFGAYPYDHITIVDPAYRSGSGGMEYPTLFTGGARWLSPPLSRSPEGVTVHEAGHQFWYGIVANNEFEHAWLDEGFNTYSTTRVMQEAFPEHGHIERYFEGFLPVVLHGVVPAERTDGADRHIGMHSALKRDAQAQPSWATGPAAYGVNAYDKGALTLRTLENYLGWTTFQNVMSTYFGEYAFRHPTPEDFFSVAERVSGVDLTWFFEQAYGDSVVFDYAVGEVDSSPVRGVRGWVEPDPGEAGPQLRTAGARGDEHTSVVHVRRWGEGVFPVTVEIRFTDGERLVEQWDGKDRWKRYAYTRAGKVDEVRIDPDHQLVLDIDSTNNSWMRRSQADVAATKWASKWVVWVQATLEAFAFFS